VITNNWEFWTVSTFADDCLAGKRVLITGALGAIGQVVVSALLAHGAIISANDIVPDEEANSLAEAHRWPADRYFYVRADITKSDEVDRMLSAVVKRTSRLDIALCHAGMVQGCPILDYSENDWDRIIDLNLKGSFLTAQAAARIMVSQETTGKIIFTSSWVQDVPWPEITPYAVTKSALRTLMRGMARELAPRGIRVNAIAPGIVGVGMAKRQWDSDPDYRRRAEKAIPLGNLQTAESVANALLFLGSDASEYMTGATLLVDGGCSLYPMD
jgi:NAD(P)-dependent dehydrogenase (short-subunit alcohol dehydrogenase family)